MEEKERFELIGYCSYRDTETGVIGDNFVDILNQQDKRMKELQQQLADNNEFFNAFACKNFNEFKDFISTFMLAPHEEQTLIRELKQQLHDLPKKIIEEIQENFDWRQCCEIRKYYDQQYIWFNYIIFNDFLDTILKKYGGEDESNND